MTTALSPSPSNYTRGGGILLLQRTGTTGYLDAGNIPDLGLDPGTQILEHKTSRGGRIVTDRREKMESQTSWNVSMDEMTPTNIAMLMQANTPSAFSQAAVTAPTLTLSIPTPTLGLWYPIGAFRLTSVIVMQSAATLTLGTDYQLDAEKGLIRPLPGGAVSPSGTLTITAGCPAISGDIVVPYSSSNLISGKAIIYYKKEDGGLWAYGRIVSGALQGVDSNLVFNAQVTFPDNAFAKAGAQLLVIPDFNQTSNFGDWIMLQPAT